jgi:hypothetical protein
MCWGAAGVGAVLALAFGLDAALGMPFGGHSRTLDILGAVGGLLIAYLAWDTSREW